MNITLENWLRKKLHEAEEMHDYSVATETVRIWIDQYNDLKKKSEVITVDYYPLFFHLANEHGLNLIDNELREIIEIVKQNNIQS